MTVLGLDIGNIRIGTALSDPDERKAKPYKTFLKGGGKALNEILGIIEKHQIKTVIAGWPLGEKGEENAQCESVKAFCRRLERRAIVTVTLVDEFLSSEEARAALGLTSKPHKAERERGMIDSQAASIILQRYLDTKLRFNRSTP